MEYDSAKKRWNARLITVGELYNNDRILAGQAENSQKQIDEIKLNSETVNSVLSTVQNNMRVLDRTLKQQVKSLQEAQEEIIKLNAGVRAFYEVEKTVIEDDTNLKEAIGKIQMFLKNIQIAASSEEKFISFQPTNILLPNKDIIQEILHVQQKLEFIKDVVNRMNNEYVLKTVQHKPSNIFKF